MQRDRYRIEQHWSIRLASTGKPKRKPLSAKTIKLIREFKREMKLRRLRKKLRIP